MESWFQKTVDFLVLSQIYFFILTECILHDTLISCDMQ